MHEFWSSSIFKCSTDWGRLSAYVVPSSLWMARLSSLNLQNWEHHISWMTVLTCGKLYSVMKKFNAGVVCIVDVASCVFPAGTDMSNHLLEGSHDRGCSVSAVLPASFAASSLPIADVVWRHCYRPFPWLLSSDVAVVVPSNCSWRPASLLSPLLEKARARSGG